MKKKIKKKIIKLKIMKKIKKKIINKNKIFLVNNNLIKMKQYI